MGLNIKQNIKEEFIALNVTCWRNQTGKGLKKISSFCWHLFISKQKWGKKKWQRILITKYLKLFPVHWGCIVPWGEAKLGFYFWDFGKLSSRTQGPSSLTGCTANVQLLFFFLKRNVIAVKYRIQRSNSQFSTCWNGLPPCTAWL